MVAISGLVYMGTNINKEYLYDAMPSKDNMDIRQEKQELVSHLLAQINCQALNNGS